MNHNGIKRYSLSRQVADQLEEMIGSGKYPVGERIPTEVELMKLFEVSRNTIREAVQALTSAGVLEVRQGDGTYVTSNNRFNANMKRQYDRVSIEDIRETRNALEQTIVRLASDRRTDQELKTIENCLIHRKSLNQSIKENTIADMEFHMAIAEACHNQILCDLYRSIADYLENHIAERQADTDLDNEQIDRMHEELFLAIKNHRSARAIECARNILNI